MHYGRNRYIHWWFADSDNYGHGFSTASSFVSTRVWYYVAAVIDYKEGKYSGYVLDIKREVKYSYTKTVNKNKGVGLSKDHSYLVIGGHVNRWYENFYGEMKDVRFFDKVAINAK
mgnify:CR=1 FL=1